MNQLRFAAALAALMAIGAAQAQSIPREGVIRDTTQPRLAAKETYNRKYGAAEQAISHCAQLGVPAPTERSLGNNRYEYVPHAAVKHATEVDMPVRGTGQKFCDYMRQAQVKQWYKQSFRL